MITIKTPESIAACNGCGKDKELFAVSFTLDGHTGLTLYLCPSCANELTVKLIKEAK